MSEQTAGDHPGTDPGNGKTQCETCGKWVWLVTHSCKGIRVYPAVVPGVADDPRGPNFAGGPTMHTGKAPATPDAGDASEPLSEEQVNALVGDDIAFWLGNPFMTPDLIAEKVRYWVAAAATRARAEALRSMADLFRDAGPKAWGGTWLTTGEHVADLVAGWCEEEAQEIEDADCLTPDTPARTKPTTASLLADLAATREADQGAREKRALGGAS